MDKNIEITIPVLNEEATLEAQVRKVIEYVNGNLDQPGSIGVVIADNGSSDCTGEIAQRLEEQFEGVRYLRLDERGVGRALKASWGSSGAEVVGYMDLDLATDLRHLKPALEALQEDRADIVTGSRLAKGARVHGRTLVREVTSRCFNTLVKAFFRSGFSDGMCGFKFLKRHCLEPLMRNGAESDGWFFATELLVTGEFMNYRVMDLPVEWTDDPDSKVKIGKLAVEYLRAMHKLKQKLKMRGADGEDYRQPGQ